MDGLVLLLMLLGALAVLAIGPKRGFQANLVVLLVAGAVSFIPFVPRFELDPELILGVVLPPLLYSAALRFSFFTFLRNLRPILGLGVGLVVMTAAAAAFLTGWLVSALGLAGALVLGAVVAPPDTVTIVGRGRALGLPRRVIAILTGESLVNDAAALALFAIALAAAAGTSTLIGNPVLLFLYGSAAGVLIGLALGLAASWARQRGGDPALESALGVVLPFAAYLAAQAVQASGVLAVVLAGFAVSVNSRFSPRERRRGPGIDYRTRIQEKQLWEVIEVLLEAFVFAYMGLQLRFVGADLVKTGASLPGTIGIGTLLLVVVIVIRFVWVFTLFGRAILRLRLRRWKLANDTEAREWIESREAKRRAHGRRARSTAPPLGWRESILVAWTGTRGIVTLAAAASIPLTTAAGTAFPGRTLIQFLAFVIATGTLLIQGPTLPLLVRLLRVDRSADDRSERVTLAKAEKVAADAGEPQPDGSGFESQRVAVIAGLHNGTLDDEAASVVLDRIDEREAAAAERPGTDL